MLFCTFLPRSNLRHLTGARLAMSGRDEPKVVIIVRLVVMSSLGDWARDVIVVDRAVMLI